MKANAPSPAAPPAAGDGRQASAAIDAWLAAREHMPQQDGEGLLNAIADRLRQIQAAPLMRDDAVVLAIIEAMPYARTMDELAGNVERLYGRVMHLLAHSGDVQPLTGGEQPPAARRRGRVTLRL